MIATKLNTNEMYQAILERDASYEGIFYTCVKTTGIFCRPSCTARKPKQENVEFVGSVKDAMDLGFRPCKVCQPLNLNGSTPAWINDLLREVETYPDVKIKDEDIKKRGSFRGFVDLV